MADANKIAQLLLEAASTVARVSSARAIVVAIDALPEIDALPMKTIVVTREPADHERVAKLEHQPLGVLDVPNVELNRLGQVKLAAVIGLSTRAIDLHDTVVFLTGPFRSIIDCMVVMSLGIEYELFDTTDQPDIDEHIKRAVFHRVLSLALSIGQHGREGKKIGTLLVVGDTKAVVDHVDQMILNPFKGYDERERNILDDAMTETIKEYATLDGAFVVRGNGVIETAGARLRAGMSPGVAGLGARHAAAAGITAKTRCIAFTVSETDGTVRVWRAGKVLASFEPSRR